jgi:seryl-tRNA synthetase
MANDVEARSEARGNFLSELVAAGLLIPSGISGLYGRGQKFEDVIERFERFISSEGTDQQAEVMRFPPLLNRAHYLKTDHIETMPQLLGSVHGIAVQATGRPEPIDRHGDWDSQLTPTGMVLVPAACYPVYPACTGVLPDGGRTVDLRAFVFRREPSDDPARMQVFRQREYVRLGTAQATLEHRDEWLRRAEAMLRSVGLECSAVLANDPFFGRGGRVMKATQREQRLKYELVVPIVSEEEPTAVVSSNCHLDHFGSAFDIRTSDGEVAHTACVGFGLERIALALFRAHGMDPATWPLQVRRVLGWD